jgi:hypothetical protein
MTIGKETVRVCCQCAQTKPSSASAALIGYPTAAPLGWTTDADQATHFNSAREAREGESLEMSIKVKLGSLHGIVPAFPDL